MNHEENENSVYPQLPHTAWPYGIDTFGFKCIIEYFEKIFN